MGLIDDLKKKGTGALIDDLKKKGTGALDKAKQSASNIKEVVTEKGEDLKEKFETYNQKFIFLDDLEVAQSLFNGSEIVQKIIDCADEAKLVDSSSKVYITVRYEDSQDKFAFSEEKVNEIFKKEVIKIEFEATYDSDDSVGSDTILIFAIK